MFEGFQSSPGLSMQAKMPIVSTTMAQKFFRMRGGSRANSSRMTPMEYDLPYPLLPQIKMAWGLRTSR
jgi:hypothetical protein